MIEKDGWKLSASVKWVPVEPDERITCKVCSGRGKRIHFGVSDDDNYDCQDCGGNGFYYTRNKRGEQPEVPKHLVMWLRDAYLDWEELYGNVLES